MLLTTTGSVAPGSERRSPEICNPALASLYDLWSCKRGDRVAPARADFDLADLRPWFGHLMLLDVTEDGRDMRFRLYGTALVGIFGFDLTGRMVSDATPLIGERPLQEYRDVAARICPSYVSRMSPSLREYLAVDKLALPLVENGRVNKILGAIYLSPRESRRATG